jgi:hypothetical protein
MKVGSGGNKQTSAGPTSDGAIAPIPVIRRIEAYAVVSIYQLAQLQRPQQIRRVS